MKKHKFPLMQYKIYTKNALGPVVIINIILSLVALFKDITLASYLGTSYVADALLLAFFLPDLIGSQLLSAGISSACVPVFSKLSVSKSQKILQRTVLLSLLFFMALAFLIFIIINHFKNSIITTLGKGFPLEASLLTQDLFIVLLPLILLFPLAAVGSALLQVNNKFNIPAAAPVFHNGIYLIGILAALILGFSIKKGVYFIAYGILLSVVVMVILIWVGLFYHKIKIISRLSEKELTTPPEENSKREVFNILKSFVPFILILFSTQIVLFFERYLASFLEVGSIAGLNYAYRLAHFPIWVFVTAVGMVILPSMSKSRGLGEDRSFRETLIKGVRIVLIITIPMTIVLYFLRFPIVSILLQRGAFNEYSITTTAGILAGYSLAVVGKGLVLILLRVFLALERMIIPLILSIVAAALHIVANYYLVGKLGSAGLGYGAAIGATINAGFFIFLLIKELGLGLFDETKWLLRIIAANIPIIIIVILFQKSWFLLPHLNGAGQLGYALIVTFVIPFIYMFSLRYFKII